MIPVSVTQDVRNYICSEIHEQATGNVQSKILEFPGYYVTTGMAEQIRHGNIKNNFKIFRPRLVKTPKMEVQRDCAKINIKDYLRRNTLLHYFFLQQVQEHVITRSLLNTPLV